ncbi:SMI1/KNR4 family protein [Acinetobacter nectaris]|uniref:SMI1/KNR4 family protein n=3 Tax=Acinetobacter nectaris TaxID=1219382 RepID=UPI001F295AC8|nr:SMI1/KNR4 family protein [Acinetobacter nectaris]MCF9028452.1 SMI1/KNR4 family protein [Acinetobacter nectaris]
MNINSIINELKYLSGENRLNIELPNDALIAKYEKEIGFIFSEDYKKVLKEVSNIFYGTIELASVTKDKKYNMELSQVLHDAKEQGLPNHWLPICEDNGSYYCLLPNNEIRYWTNDGYSDETWLNLADWIKKVWIEGN